jgi:UDP-N-acetylglucosamine transferase subunit ALG13
VTVGTALDPFDRMLRMVDQALPSAQIDGVCQYGSSTFKPRHLEARRVLSRAEFEQELQRSDIVICQGGVGSIRSALDAGHRPIVVARVAAHGEHVNDHQMEICRALGETGQIVWVLSASELSSALVAGSTRVPRPLDEGELAKSLQRVAEALNGLVSASASTSRPRLLHLLGRLCPVSNLQVPTKAG